MRHDIDRKINEWDMIGIPDVLTVASSDEATTVEVLERMQQTGTYVMPIIDSQERYLGVVTRAEIVERIVVDLTLLR
jgi:CBS-domain-containing membrane protein